MYKIASLIIFGLAVVGCGSEREASGAPVHSDKSLGASHVVIIDKPSEPYRVVSISNGGTVSGTVEIDSTVAVPADTVYTPSEAKYCGASITERKAMVNSGKVADVIVWLTDIRSGKALPITKRFELTTSKCNYEPRVQAITTGGTLNLINEDALVHTVRLTNDATGEMDAHAPFNDNGEVVPFDNILREPKLLAVTSNVYPWAKAWVAVLDHPYFAVTNRDGSFEISDVPAGTYQVKAYHPVLGVATDTVSISAGSTTKAVFNLRR